MAGTTNSVNSVPIASPLVITRPILKRETAPAPVARIKGITPKTIAAVVIRIGRGGLLDGLALRRAAALQLIREFDDQEPVPADQAHQRDQADAHFAGGYAAGLLLPSHPSNGRYQPADRPTAFAAGR